MCDVDKIVKLLAQTDGRDKLYKSAAGLSKILAFYGDKESGKKWKALNKSIGDGRSLMRMGKWIGNYQKLQAFAAQSSKLTQYNMLEILRVIGDFGYVLGDNLQYLAKYGVLPIDQKRAAQNSKIFQFWGFVCAVILDLWSLTILPTKKLEKADYEKKRKALILSFIKNFADLLNCLNNVGYAGSLYKPNDAFLGACTFTSGAIASWTNWEKLSK